MSTRISLSSIATSTSSALWQDSDRHCGGVDPALRFRLWNALDAVNAAFELEPGIHPASPDKRDQLLDAAHLGIVAGRHFDPPRLRFGVLAVHPIDLVSEQRGLVAAGAGANLKHCSLFIRRVDRKQQDANFVRHPLLCCLQ